MTKAVRRRLASLVLAGLVLAALVLAGAVLAAATVIAVPAAAQTVAPASDAAFVLFEYQIHDQANFPAFSAKVRESLKDSKGAFVKREKVPSVFGGGPATLSVISFPSAQDARDWLASPAVVALKAARARVADVDTYLVEKLD